MFLKRDLIALVCIASYLCFLLVPTAAYGQQTTTDTNCNVNATTVNCNSTTNDNAAQQQRAYEQGRQVGAALGTGIAAGMQAHSQSKWVKHFCEANPGRNWKFTRTADGAVTLKGHCPSDEDRGVQAASQFMSKHKDYIAGTANSEVLTAYLESHKYDPRKEKSYERAYKDLKKSGKLELYAR